MEAIRIGIAEVVKLRREIAIGPVSLTQSQEIRLQRLMPRAVLRSSDAKLFVPLPGAGKVLPFLIDFLRAMWPHPSDS